MTPNGALFLFLVVLYGGFAAAVKVSNWSAGKHWSDGPSLIPIIPLFPAAALLVGWLVNMAASPWGSWGVAGLHVGWLLVALVLIGSNSETDPDSGLPERDERVAQIRSVFGPAIGARITAYATAEIQHDDGTWDAWPDLPIRLELDSGQLISTSWSKFDDLWITSDASLPFSAEGTTFRWVRNSIDHLNGALGAAIRSVMLGQGEFSIDGREVEIWTRLVIETDQGWLEIYNALDENGYDLHAELPSGTFIPCT